MRVESAEQGIRFEWSGEGTPTERVVAVAMQGPRLQSLERLELLHSTIRGMRHGGVAWSDLEARERHFSAKGEDPLLMWRGEFEDWQTAAAVFALLCRAIGMEDDSVALEVEM